MCRPAQGLRWRYEDERRVDDDDDDVEEGTQLLMLKWNADGDEEFWGMGKMGVLVGRDEGKAEEGEG